MRKLIKDRMENKVANFVGLNKVVLGIKWKIVLASKFQSNVFGQEKSASTLID